MQKFQTKTKVMRNYEGGLGKSAVKTVDARHGKTVHRSDAENRGERIASTLRKRALKERLIELDLDEI